MNTEDSQELPSKLAHRRDFVLKILTPVLLAIILIILVVALIFIPPQPSTGATQDWAAISLIVLLLPVFLLGFLVLATIILAIIAIHKFGSFLPPVFAKLNPRVSELNRGVNKLSSLFTNPVIKLKTTQAGVTRLFSSLFTKRFPTKEE